MQKLTPTVEKFVLHWGEMGARWGINRTVAQIHALLYLSPKALNAEDLAGTLSIARSNVSNSLRELQGWGIVRIVHNLGDRRDHFETIGDVWEMFRVITEQRKRREIDPTIALLRECAAEAGRGNDGYIKERLGNLLDFFETVEGWYQEVIRLPQAALVQFLRLGGRLRKLFGLGNKN